MSVEEVVGTSPAWRAAALVKAARAATIREWVVRGAIEHGWPVNPVAELKPKPGNRRTRRSAKARARGHVRGAEPFLVPTKPPKAVGLPERADLGTIVAIEPGVLHVRTPNGTAARIELAADDTEGWYVVGGVLTVAGVKARAW